MRASDGSITPLELFAIETIWLGGSADLSNATRPELGQVDSRTAKRLQKAGLVEIDAGACARLTEAGERYVRRDVDA